MSSRPSKMTLTRPGPVRLWSTKELLEMPDPEWQIGGVFTQGGLVALYGRPGSGKTFIALDMALSIATGHSWQGREVQKGYVVYIAAEGGSGLKKRVATWLQARGYTHKQAKIAWLIEPVYLYAESEHIERLVKRLSEEVSRDPSLIVVDTLARCFMGDENQQEDMGKFVAGLDQLRRECDATTLVVHHTRLDGDRERGNTAFRGAADAMLSVSKHARPEGSHGVPLRTNLTLECNKQKDGAEFDPIKLKLLTVPDTDSCVIEELPEEPTMIYDPEAKKTHLLSILVKQGGRIERADWLSECGLPKTSFTRLVNQMRTDGLIAGEHGTYWIVSD